MARRAGLAVYPGSFDPPTVAHLAIARAALAVPGVEEVRLVLSERALGKDTGHAPVAERRRVLEAVAASEPGLAVAVTRARLVADIVAEAGAAAVVVGADKWAQVVDPAWYDGSVARRDAAVAALGRVLLAPRAGALVAGEVELLAVDGAHAEVSATRARAGEAHLMLPEAAASGLWARGAHGRPPF